MSSASCAVTRWTSSSRTATAAASSRVISSSVIQRDVTAAAVRRSASARLKSSRVTMPVTRPPSTIGMISTRWCRKISASSVSEKSSPTSMCSVFMCLPTGSSTQVARFSSASSSERGMKPA